MRPLDMEFTAACQAKHSLCISTNQEECGEDGFAVVQDGTHIMMGKFSLAEPLMSAVVCDGVGGWRSEGIDPKPFVNRVVAECEAEFFHNDYLAFRRPLSILERGFGNILHSEGNWHRHQASPTTLVGSRSEATMAKRRQPRCSCVLTLDRGLAGSCTSAMAVLDKQTGQLTIHTLGDSTVMVVRNGAVQFRTVEMQHEFNMPFQMGVANGENAHEHPRDGRESVVQLQQGDIVVVGSDGFFDNLFEKDILGIIARHEQNMQSPRTGAAFRTGGMAALANELVARARNASMRVFNDTPFSKSAAKHRGRASGGYISLNSNRLENQMI